MDKFSGLLKIIYFCILTLCFLFGAILNILTYIPFSKGQWFDLASNICAICMLILLMPLLLYLVIKSIKKHKETIKIILCISYILFMISCLAVMVMKILCFIPFPKNEIFNLLCDIFTFLMCAFGIPPIICIIIYFKKRKES